MQVRIWKDLCEYRCYCGIPYTHKMLGQIFLVFIGRDITYVHLKTAEITNLNLSTNTKNLNVNNKNYLQ